MLHCKIDHELVACHDVVLNVRQCFKANPRLSAISLLRYCDLCNRTKLKDSGKLSDYDIKNGAILSLVILPPFLVYVQGTDGRKHTVTVKSSEPEVSAVMNLRISL